MTEWWCHTPRALEQRRGAWRWNRVSVSAFDQFKQIDDELRAARPELTRIGIQAVRSAIKRADEAMASFFRRWVTAERSRAPRASSPAVGSKAPSTTNRFLGPCGASDQVRKMPSSVCATYLAADPYGGPMRISLWPTTAQSWADLLDAASYAAETGWDGVWVADHFMPNTASADGPMLECFTVLAGLATAVPRVRLGSLVAGNTYRHPAVLAKMVATLDHLSGGRAVLGLGAGWQENEHHAYGIEFSDVPGRLSRLEEACAVVRGLFDGDRTTVSGRYYTVTDAPAQPRPVQSRLPLLVGGGGEKVTLRITARWADEWNTWGTPDHLAQKGAVLDRHCEAIGRDPREITRSAQVVVDLDGAGQPFDRPMPKVSGSPAQLQELLGGYVEAGVGEFIGPDWNLGTGAPRRELMDRFLAEVALPFRNT